MVPTRSLRTADRELAEARAAGKPPTKPLPPNALLQGLAPSAYVLKASDLERALFGAPHVLAGLSTTG